MTKRADYAEARISEYWIADPRDETITVLALQGGAYVEHGVYARGDRAMSPLLAGLVAEVSAVSTHRMSKRERRSKREVTESATTSLHSGRSIP